MENRLQLLLTKFSNQLYIGWILIIALLTLVPGKALPLQINWDFLSMDKVGHFSIFTIMAFIGTVNFKTLLGSGNTLKPSLISLLIAVFYGIILEYAQTFIPDRGFDYADLTANISGAIFGIVLFILLKNKITK